MHTKDADRGSQDELGTVNLWNEVSPLQNTSKHTMDD